MSTLSAGDDGGWNECRQRSDADLLFDPDTAQVAKILDAVAFSVLVVRSDFKIAHFNDAATDVLKLAPSDIGRSPLEVPSLSGLVKLDRWCAHVIGVNAPTQHDFRMAEKFFIIRISPFTKSNGQISGTVLTFTNVTAFRASIDQAVYEREYTKTILNTVADPLVVLGADLHIETANRSFYSTFGVSRDTIRGVALSELSNRALDFPWLVTRLKETIAGHRAAAAFEVACELPEIGRRTLLLEACRFTLPRLSIPMLLLGFHDITSRKEAEVANSKLAAVVEFSDDAIVTKDIDGIITSWNGGARRLFGYAANEVIGKPMMLIIPLERRGEEFDILARIRRGERTENYDTVRQRKNGSLVEVSVAISPLKDGQGKIIGASNVARDITDRKHEMRALTRLNQLNVLLVRDRSEFNECLYGILDAALFISGADKGNIQLLESSSGTLKIVAQRGFEEPFLKYFAQVSDEHSVCGLAMQTADRVIVDDVTRSEIFVGQPSLNVLLEAGVRAVISTPLKSSSGNLLGMISTHFGGQRPASEHELRLTDILARQAADYLERKRAEDSINFLAREVDHRAKNLLALVQATVHLTQADTVDALKEVIEGRIRALSNVHTLLAQSRWAGAGLRRLLEDELSPYCPNGASRADFDGPEVILQTPVAQLVAMVLHELTTNAVKYGALSVLSGRIRIDWSCTANGKLVLRWIESGGPPVKPPTRQGFGTRVLDRAIRDQLKGKIRFDWRVEGLACEIEIDS